MESDGQARHGKGLFVPLFFPFSFVFKHHKRPGTLWSSAPVQGLCTFFLFLFLFCFQTPQGGLENYGQAGMIKSRLSMTKNMKKRKRRSNKRAIVKSLVFL
jgi:hypothetical protein